MLNKTLFLPKKKKNYIIKNKNLSNNNSLKSKTVLVINNSSYLDEDL